MAKMIMINKPSVIDIVEHYGSYNQKLKAVEELCELQQSLLQEINKLDETGIVEEMADVHIMLAQLMVIYDVDKEDLLDMVRYKLQRQYQRMQFEKGVNNGKK